ncbi:DUF4062 domain-containing protein [Clostridium tertium]|jgi:hypothetical protein|uniref:DUF4062 domain-containing protein n=1 Tax=Clostridium tertium TaxID=1559 RepID=UPI0018AA885D|nr:DUF4062 domain-containing protein [Clostridium tertium]DAZ20928.1 MAG TPA: deoxyribosyltransferase [Caudoviricetes sp.]
MEKRYQVFISSTFADLEEERKEVMEAIINLNCFPAGMEMFPAADIEQFEYIKTIIDQSDYYVLVIAGRYGSVAEDGKSYTEKEYEYAREKGIPVLVFVKKDIENIPASQTDNNLKLKEKLLEFRENAMKNRLAKFWNEKMQLKYEVYDSLSKCIKMMPREGWIKGDTPTNSETIIQLDKLRKDKIELEDKIKYLSSQLEEKNEIKDIAQGDDKIAINYIYDCYDHGEENEKGQVSITWNQLFMMIAPEFELSKTINAAMNIIEDSINRLADRIYDSIEINKDDFNVIKYQFDALDLIKIIINKSNEGMVLTDRGRSTLRNMIIKKKELG